MIFQGQPSDAVLADTPSMIKYTVKLDYTTGPFNYGELALFMSNGQMFAIGVFDTLQHKDAQSIGGSVGEATRFDIYVQTDGNYAVWLDIAESSNQFRMAVLRSLNDLPQAKDAIPNAYIIQGEDSQQSAFLAYTDRNALWNFDAYYYSIKKEMQTQTVTLNSVTVDAASWDPQLNPAFVGQTILQFATGNMYGVCRYVTSATLSGDGQRYTLGLSAPITFVPSGPQTIILHSRVALSYSASILPVATPTELGAVKIGASLSITVDGLLNINQMAIPVQSVNGKIGDVVLNYQDLGLATVAQTGSYNDLIDKPNLTIPIASTTTVGGVKAPAGANANLVVAPDGTIDLSFVPVKTVRGQSPNTQGNVALTFSGFADAMQVAADLNTLTTTGLFYSNVSGLTNAPSGVTGLVYVEVIALSPTSVVQSVISGNTTYHRQLSGTSWSDWSAALVIGDLAPLWNTQNNPPSLSSIQGTGDDEFYTKIRIAARQLPVEGYTFSGFWTPVDNTVNSDPNFQLMDNGLMTMQVDNGTGLVPVVVSGVGRVFRVDAIGNFMLDGNDTWVEDDVIVGLDDKWICVRASQLLLNRWELGALNGVCPLNALGQVDSNYLPPGSTGTGNDRYQGEWDADLNSPDIRLLADEGMYWKVTVAGTFDPDPDNPSDTPIQFYVNDYVRFQNYEFVRTRDAVFDIVPTSKTFEQDVTVEGLLTANGGINTDTVVATGALEGASLDVSGAASVDSLAVANSITATSVTASGAVQANSVNATAGVTAASVTATGAMQADSLTVTNAIQGDSLAVDTLTVQGPGVSNLNGPVVAEELTAKIVSSMEAFNTITHSVAGNVNVDTSSNIHNLLLNADATLVIDASALPAGYVYSKTFIITNGGAFNVTWPANAKWTDGNPQAVTGVAGKIDVFTLTTFDQGASWLIFVGGKNF